MVRSFLLLLIALVPAATWPAGLTAVVAAGNCQDPALPGHARAVRAALAERLGPAIQSEDETAGPLGGVAQGSFAEADRLLNEAYGEIFSNEVIPNAQYEKKAHRAETALKKAAELILAQPPSAERWKKLLRERSLELRVYWARDRQAEVAALESILRVAPEYVFDPDVFSPPQIKDFEDLRKKLRARSLATLKLTSRPAGSGGPVFYLDGSEVGAAPLVLKVPTGKYRLEAAFGPRRGIARTITISGPVELEIDSEFERLVRLDRGLCLAAERTSDDYSAALARLGSLVGAQTIVGVWSERASNESYLVLEAIDSTTGRKRGGAAVKLVNGKPPPPSALSPLWDLLSGTEPQLSLKAPRPGAAVLAPLPSPVSPPPTWMRPTSYVAGGLAIGLAGFATYEALSARRSYSRADGILQPDGTVADAAARGRYGDAIQDARSAKRMAYVGAGSALVSGAAAGLLWYLSREPGPPAFRF